jgi:hypothetical protein
MDISRRLAAYSEEQWEDECGNKSWLLKQLVRPVTVFWSSETNMDVLHQYLEHSCDMLRVESRLVGLKTLGQFGEQRM